MWQLMSLERPAGELRGLVFGLIVFDGKIMAFEPLQLLFEVNYFAWHPSLFLVPVIFVLAQYIVLLSYNVVLRSMLGHI